MLDTSRIDFGFELELPLHGTVNNFIIQDTLDLALPEMNDIQSLLLKITTTNGFPTDARLQLYLTDSLYKITDSIVNLGQSIVNSGIINTSGVVIKPNHTVSTITLDENKLEKFKKASFMILQGKLETSNKGITPVKFYSTYKLDIKISAKASAKIQL